MSEVYSLKNLFIKETVTLRYNMTTSKSLRSFFETSYAWKSNAWHKL